MAKSSLALTESSTSFGDHMPPPLLSERPIPRQKHRTRRRGLRTPGRETSPPSDEASLATKEGQVARGVPADKSGVVWPIPGTVEEELERTHEEATPPRNKRGERAQNP